MRPDFLLGLFEENVRVINSGFLFLFFFHVLPETSLVPGLMESAQITLGTSHFNLVAVPNDSRCTGNPSSCEYDEYVM